MLLQPTALLFSAIALKLSVYTLTMSQFYLRAKPAHRNMETALPVFSLPYLCAHWLALK